MGSLALSLLPFAPTIDGAVFPDAPLNAITAGEGSEIPLMIGSNRDEARLFFIAAGIIDLIDDATLEGIATAYGLAPEGLAVYRANRPSASPGDRLAAVVTDWFFRIQPSASPKLAPPLASPGPGFIASITRTRNQPSTGRMPRRRDPVRVGHRHPGGDPTRASATRRLRQ